MAHKEKRPAAATAKALQKNNSPLFYSASQPEIQALQLAFLARRHRFAPSMARIVAGLVFGEARQ